MVRPRNAAQANYIEMLRGDCSVVVAIGPAGTAKTHIATTVGVQKLIDGEVDRIVITRPAVSVDEEHGFLPGSIEDKLQPWLMPVTSALHKALGAAAVSDMMASRRIEIAPVRSPTWDSIESQASSVSRLVGLARDSSRRISRARPRCPPRSSSSAYRRAVAMSVGLRS